MAYPRYCMSFGDLTYLRDMTTDEFYQIGYCGIGQENLDPEQPGDLKE